LVEALVQKEAHELVCLKRNGILEQVQLLAGNILLQEAFSVINKAGCFSYPILGSSEEHEVGNLELLDQVLSKLRILLDLLV
jgi:hypothetical protein